jgi:hypothetical protein
MAAFKTRYTGHGPTSKQAGSRMVGGSLLVRYAARVMVAAVILILTAAALPVASIGAAGVSPNPLRLPAVQTSADVKCGDVPGLIDAINAANKSRVASTIRLNSDSKPGCVYTLTAAYGGYEGQTGLPAASSSSKVSIQGNGATIERSAAPNTRAFRLLHVAKGVTVEINDLTIRNGYARMQGTQYALGGAIYNEGDLTLTDCSLENNLAEGDGEASTVPPGAGSSSSGALYRGTLPGCLTCPAPAAPYTLPADRWSLSRARFGSTKGNGRCNFRQGRLGKVVKQHLHR